MTDVDGGLPLRPGHTTTRQAFRRWMTRIAPPDRRQPLNGGVVCYSHRRVESRFERLCQPTSVELVGPKIGAVMMRHRRMTPGNPTETRSKHSVYTGELAKALLTAIDAFSDMRRLWNRERTI